MRGYCTSCKKVTDLIPSNNPMFPGICQNCLNQFVDINDLKQANFFCRTYNIPFKPEKWLEISKEAGSDTFYYYTDVIKNEYPNSLYNGDTTEDL